MGWSEFVYLGLGLGLGIVLGRLLGGKGKQSSESLITDDSATTSNDEQQVQVLSHQLKQTQLAYQMAAEMSLFKAGFLARTSHELRSPLNSMIGSLQLILGDLCESPEEEQEFIQHAHASALKMVELLDQVIFVSKTEYGTETMDIHGIQLAKVLDEVEDLTCMQAANRSIRLKIEPPDEDIYVLADLPRLRQVLVSLVDTAIAQMSEGSVKVSVHPSPETGFIHIWVEDQRPISAWSESWDLLKSTLEKDQTPINQMTLSPGMRLLMNQTLLSLMNGRLEVLAIPSEGEESNFNRTQCSIPMVK
ncbi:sensor histidine kinase KdpD [Planktothrix sp. FACHB-1365]|uniref:sensor histidine kinase n=1 Tax=Planktothrix sp. FACHB-1365 TaxID=2692855 RepID=UPI001685D8E4|nr:HAMP domain-containing sensor histidine kinase [Planktothrix sp. FACHB-1365]MBD2481709.1 HAMP domain-containing histidine kinase [Planktothrix sp. FACHB-1365]